VRDYGQKKPEPNCQNAPLLESTMLFVIALPDLHGGQISPASCLQCQRNGNSADSASTIPSDEAAAQAAELKKTRVHLRRVVSSRSPIVGEHHCGD
jgi:hypothetical protein